MKLVQNELNLIGREINLYKMIVYIYYFYMAHFLYNINIYNIFILNLISKPK